MAFQEREKVLRRSPSAERHRGRSLQRHTQCRHSRGAVKPQQRAYAEQPAKSEQPTNPLAVQGPPNRIVQSLHRARLAVARDSLGSADSTAADGKVGGDCPVVPRAVAGVAFRAFLPLGTLRAMAFECHFERFACCANRKRKNGVGDFADSIK